jgi:hypothetical protein
MAHNICDESHYDQMKVLLIILYEFILFLKLYKLDPCNYKL